MDVMIALQWLQQHSIIFMFVAFVMILVTTFWPGRKKTFDRDARIPFQD